MKNMKRKTLAAIIGLSSALNACVGKTGSFSMLAQNDAYEQAATYIPRKIDILWVVDNSGSMATSQESVAQSFAAFIQRFQTLNYDYRIGVIATDGWKSQFVGGDFSNLRDGSPADRSGVFVIDKFTPNIEQVFLTNIKLGIGGTGDERAFSSIEVALNDPDNAGFRRPDAFLAVIIVSDEDDFSHGTSSYLFNNYNHPSLHTVDRYVDILNQHTGTLAGEVGKNYSVSAIAVLDQSCRDTLNTDGFQRIIGQRYIDIAAKTGGVTASLCGNFGETLTLISDSIIGLSAEFKLTREPIVETLSVVVDGVVIPNDNQNGWTYRAADKTIIFHGSAIPAAGANVQITFDPVSIKI